MGSYLSDGMEYDVDGDVIDKRDRLISELKGQLYRFNKQEKVEIELRDEHPALKDAYEKYQTVLKMVEHA